MVMTTNTTTTTVLSCMARTCKVCRPIQQYPRAKMQVLVTAIVSRVVVCQEVLQERWRRSVSAAARQLDTVLLQVCPASRHPPPSSWPRRIDWLHSKSHGLAYLHASLVLPPWRRIAFLYNSVYNSTITSARVKKRGLLFLLLIHFHG